MRARRHGRNETRFVFVKALAGATQCGSILRAAGRFAALFTGKVGDEIGGQVVYDDE